MKELDVVALTIDLPDFGRRRGNVGTVVQVYGANAVEVEFIDDSGRTDGLTKLSDEQLLRPQFISTARAA